MSLSSQHPPTQKPLTLTKEGKQTLATAQAIAAAHGHQLLTSHHILLGILETRGSYGGQALAQFPIKPEHLKTRLWAYIRLDAGEDKEPHGGEFFGFALSEDGARAMEATVQEAEDQHAEAIDSRLMILGMLRRPETSAGEILRQFDITHDEFLRLSQRIDPKPAPSSSSVIRRAHKRPKVRRGGLWPHISPIFLLLVAIFAGLGYMLYADIGEPGRLTFIFVLTGWILAVSLHEFGHALTAYLSGDESVLYMGYLTLDPLKYTHPLMSILFPIIFLLMGGIPLPGGAVYINRGAIRKRWQQSAVSAAGPLATLIFGLLLLAPFMFGLSEASLREHTFFWSAIALLGFFQLFAFVLNLIPWPGLDGFGILEPYLPPFILHYAYMLSGMGIFLFFLLFAYTPFGSQVARSVELIMQSISAEAYFLVGLGYQSFFFWQ